MAEELFASLPGDAEDAEPDENPPDNRRGARQVALQAFYWETSSPGEVRAALRKLGESFQHSEPVRDFASRLVDTVEEYRPRLDELIDGAADHWSQDRMARLDVLILRLALAEILYIDDIPVRASIDEAIELAKTYSTGQSYAFINGVLDAVVRQQGLSL